MTEPIIAVFAGGTSAENEVSRGSGAACALFLARSFTTRLFPIIADALTSGDGLRRVSLQEAEALVPALRPGYLAGAAIEEDAFDMDVAAIHQGFLRMLRTNGGVLGLRSRAGRIERRGDAWDIATASGDVYRAPVVVRSSKGASPNEAIRPWEALNSAMFFSLKVNVCCLSTPRSSRSMPAFGVSRGWRVEHEHF